MRIIAGQFRSRRIKTVSGLLVRPTPDRLRETLFNVLAPILEGKIFLDAYAGSGAVGIEALSRGAAKIILFENHPEALAVIRQNLTDLAIEQSVTVVRGSAAKLIPKFSCDIAFIDPPYTAPNEYQASLSALDQAECPRVIAQHERKLVLADCYGNLKKVRSLKQGDNLLTFFERSTEY